jgi:hypothetical protein
MTAYRAGTARVSSTVTKTVGTNPRPRKYATASERQAAYRARAPEVCFRAEAKTVETLDNIADTLDQSRADLLLSMTKFALANHDWARFGLTHRPLPYGYGVQPATNPAPIWKRKRPKSLGKPVPLTPKQKAAAKAMAKAAGRKYPNLVDNIAASRKVNPMKKPSTIDKSMDLDTLAERVFTDGDWPSDYLEIAKALRSILVRDKRAYGWTTIGSVEDVDWFRSVKEATNKVRGSTRKVNPMKKPTPAQLAARAKFAAMARSGAFKRKAKAKAAPKVKTSAGSYKVMTRDGDIEIEGVTMAQAKKYIADRAKKTKRFAGFWSVVKANPVKKTVSEKISQLVREGYPQKQAVAVALSEERAGKVKRNPITETLIYGLAPGETRDYMEELLYGGGLKLTPEQVQKVLNAATAAGYHSFRITGFDPTVGATFVRTMGQGRKRKTNPATGAKKSRTKLNPQGKKVYEVYRTKTRNYAKGMPRSKVLATFNAKADAVQYAQAYADAYGVILRIRSVTL